MLRAAFFFGLSLFWGRGERGGKQRVFLGANPGLCKTISAPGGVFSLPQKSPLAEANLRRGRGAGSGGRGPPPRCRPLRSPTPAREDAFLFPGGCSRDETFAWTDRDWTF